MTEEALYKVILDLGMETVIPLWEVASTCRMAGLVAEGTEGVETLAETLMNLARQDKIRILVGHWDDPEPRYVNLDEAAALLADSRRYTSEEEIANDLERVYYVNVDNIVT